MVQNPAEPVVVGVGEVGEDLVEGAEIGVDAARGESGEGFGEGVYVVDELGAGEA